MVESEKSKGRRKGQQREEKSGRNRAGVNLDDDLTKSIAKIVEKKNGNINQGGERGRLRGWHSKSGLTTMPCGNNKKRGLEKKKTGKDLGEEWKGQRLDPSSGGHIKKGKTLKKRQNLKVQEKQTMGTGQKLPDYWRGSPVVGGGDIKGG